MVKGVTQDPQVPKENLDFKACQALVERKVNEGTKDLLEVKVIVDQMELPVMTELQDCQESLEKWVLVVFQDLVALLVCLGHQYVSKEPKGTFCSILSKLLIFDRVFLVLRAVKVPKVTRGPQDLLGHLVKLGVKDPLDHLYVSLSSLFSKLLLI